MLGLLAPLLGGLGGLLFPAAGAAATGAAATGIGGLLARAALPALGAGLGTVLTGGSGKDAIRNALIFGAGSAAFPGLGEKLRGSEFGKGITGGLAEIFGGGGGAQGPVSQSRTETMASRPQSRPSAIPQMEMPDGQGMSGMEMEARRRTTLPSISDINMVRPEGLRTPYDMVRPEGLQTPYNMDGMSLNEATDLLGEDIIGYGFGRVDPRLYEASRRRMIPRSEGFAMGGAIEGPGTGTSDSIPAEIYQDGKPVRKAALSDGEFVMTADAVKGAGNGSRERGISRMYELMRRFESGEMA